MDFESSVREADLIFRIQSASEESSRIFGQAVIVQSPQRKQSAAHVIARVEIAHVVIPVRFSARNFTPARRVERIAVEVFFPYQLPRILFLDRAGCAAKRRHTNKRQSANYTFRHTSIFYFRIFLATKIIIRIKLTINTPPQQTT